MAGTGGQLVSVSIPSVEGGTPTYSLLRSARLHWLLCQGHGKIAEEPRIVGLREGPLDERGAPPGRKGVARQAEKAAVKAIAAQVEAAAVLDMCVGKGQRALPVR